LSKIGPERLTALLPSDPGGEPALPADAEMITTIDVFVTGRASTQGKTGLVSIIENEAIAFIIAPDYSTRCDPVIASKASGLRGPAPDPVKQFTSRR
jgi:hypothetical protein